MRKRKLIIILIWLPFVLIVLLLGGYSSEVYSNRSKVVEGIIDLNQRELDEEVIKLDGQWEFYWNQLLEPGELKEIGIQRSGYIDIPSSWNRYIINDKELSGDGYATYRLLFKTDKNGRLGIKNINIL